ncbi:energy transducer TonB family protein [Qipengyuania mesophila]|uniref:energy transducer TonB family protein n=1 Tax=Qipengyuania mesophila TaxID=2867246 RepID=UPI0035146522
MKLPLFALAAALSLTAVPATSQEIVVSADAAALDLVSRDLDRNLLRAEWPRASTTGEGLVMVRFHRGADGRPEEVTLYRASGRHDVDRLALRAVAALGRSAPLPAFGGAGQVYQANVILANSGQAHASLQGQLTRLEQARLADPRERSVLAFGGTPRDAG